METRTLIRTDKNGTAYYNVVYPCHACRGTGYRPEYAHVEGGVCFECGGSGRCETTEKVYTEEYLNRKAARAEAKEAARKAAWTPEAELAKIGYGEMIGIVISSRGDTFYGEDFKWLIRYADCAYRGGAVVASAGNLQLAAAGYQILPVRWDELLDADYENCCLTWKEGGAKAAVKAHTYNFPPKPKFESAFVGAEGEKVTVDVRLTRVSGFESHFGYTNVYTFEDANHNVLVWKTGTCLDLEVGAYTTLTGTIKEPSEYRDTKQTVLTRCKLAAA